MKQKIIISLVTSCFVYTLAQEKPTELPPLQPRNIVDSSVQKFLQDERGQTTRLQRKNNPRDILGRLQKASTSRSFYYVARDDVKRLDVTITDIDYRNSNEPTITGRYEIDKNGNVQLWLNGEKIKLDEYEEKISSLTNRKYIQPSYRAYLSAEEISSLLESGKKVWISEYKQPKNTMDYDLIFDLSQISTHAHSNNYKGLGIGVYFTETGCPNPSYLNTSYYSQENYCNNGIRAHATGVAQVLQRTAPQATIYGYDQLNYPNPDTTNPKIEIGSHSWAVCFDDEYCSEDAAMDQYIYDNRVIVFVCAGNKNEDILDYWVSSPGKAANAITVGAVDSSSNYYEWYSMWKNSEVGNQKPEIANYTNFNFYDVVPFTDNYGDTYTGFFNGTSASTPYSAGFAANLLQQYPFYKRHPELYKALLLSGEKINISNANSHDTDNNTIAAKGIARYSSMAWNHRNRTWSGTNNCCFNQYNQIVFEENNISVGVHYRIAIAWLTSASYIAANNTIAQDIDLNVYQNDSLIASSLSSFNPFEVVDFTTNSNSNLRIVINRYANSGSDNVILGYSLWNDL